MSIRRLRLEKIRCYGAATLEASDPKIVFFGNNGAGKTTLLEAIHALATTRSFRTGRLADLLASGAEEGVVFGQVEPHGRELQIELAPRSRRLRRDQKPVTSAAAFADSFAVVALAPEHQALVAGGPDERRKYLDRLVFAINPTYLDVAQRYQRALKQKQALLRDLLPWAVFEDRVAPWNEELCRFGEQIRLCRKSLVESLGPVVQEEMSYLGLGKEEIQLIYQPKEGEMTSAMTDKMSAEAAAGRCLVGPHRDELRIEFQGEVAETVASQGERSAILLALKWAEIRLAEGARSERPTLLLDDLGATLDYARRERLLARLAEWSGQAFLTTADEALRDAAVGAGAAIYTRKNETSLEGFSIARWAP